MPPHRTRPVQWAILALSAGIVVAIDQLAKGWVLANVPFGTSRFPIPALSDFLAITASQNRGAAFSILPQAADLFLIIAIVMLGAIPFFYRRLPPGHWPERIAMGTLLGGVAGNAIDRIRLGYVVDFVHIQIRPLISNVSNLADHAIVLSILVLLVAEALQRRSPAPESPSPEQPDNVPSSPPS
ncbi:MAG TPA: signal peptidase II [Aggregatilineales bacterium]|nr:signal peptidase II [Aggregatilineales bacterium]